MTQTRALSEDEWTRRAVPARDRVFAALDAYAEPFTGAVAERGLLFPVSYELEPGQTAVMKKAARTVGDESIFLELLEYSTTDQRYHEFSSDGEGPYDLVQPIVMNAIFSPSGQWGLILSEEDHAVIGGSPEFMRVIAAELPPSEHPAQIFWGPSESFLDEMPDDAPVEEKVASLLARSEAIPVASGRAFGDEQAFAFIGFWKILRDTGGVSGVGDWLPSLLRHIYGEKRARRLLQLGGW